MDDAFVEADKVGVSTDVPGTSRKSGVPRISMSRPDKFYLDWTISPLRLALARAEAQIGTRPRCLECTQGKLPRHAVSNPAGPERHRLFRHRIPPSAGSLAAHCGIAIDLRYGSPETCRMRSRSSLPDSSLRHWPPIWTTTPPARWRRCLVTSTPSRSAMSRRGNSRTPLSRRLSPALVTNVPSIAVGKYLQASVTAFYLVAADHVWLSPIPKRPS